MLQLWVIALLATVYLHDQIVGGLGLHRHVHAEPISIWAISAALGPYIVLAAVTHLVCWACAKEMDRRGSLRSVTLAERTLMVSRLVAVLTHILAVLTLGWVEQVRAVVGDPIMLDELIAVTPPLLVFVAGWWSFYPIEQRLRNVVWVRVLEDGQPLYPTPTRGQFVWSNLRHQLLFLLVPLTLVGVWSESLSRVIEWLVRHRGAPGTIGRLAGWLADENTAEAVRTVAQFVGLALVFTFAPLLMRLVWDAIPLGPGPLRDRLMAVCQRAGVRVRELLVWRTHGTMVNGVATGVFGPLRYILLTDGLLDNLPARQAEGVMAHEVGHAKYHHIPWTVMGMVAAMGFAALAVAIGLGLVSLLLPRSISHALEFGPLGLDLRQAGAMPVSIVVAFAGFGWISRRFEWQADAFAAKQLSKDDPGATAVTQEAVEAMCDALGTVAALNHMSPSQRSFRHGSIALRQSRLRRLIGVPLERLPIDRAARWIKGGIVLGVAVVLAGVAAESALPKRSEPEVEYRPSILIRHWPQSRLEDAP